jgi:hypothetical protein
MDGTKKLERNRATRAVSANVHTRVSGRVSFGEPAENSGPGHGRFTRFSLDDLIAFSVCGVAEVQ